MGRTMRLIVLAVLLVATPAQVAYATDSVRKAEHPESRAPGKPSTRKVRRKRPPQRGFRSSIETPEFWMKTDLAASVCAPRLLSRHSWRGKTRSSLPP